MLNATVQVPVPRNEPELSYQPGTPERELMKQTLATMSAQTVEVPLVIGGREVRTGRTADMRAPHRHDLLLGRFHQAGGDEVQQAIRAALDAQPAWSALPWEARAAVFLKAAELLSTRYRPILSAATMLGQSKTVHQAEIDAACELIDFYRFNTAFMTRLYAEQPASAPGTWNILDYRPLEGFVFAATPFNFTSIAGNLPTAPALMGNTVLWKPASSAVYSAHFLMQLWIEAGLPPGVINLVPGPGAAVGDPVLASPHLAGVHFTGSTRTFQSMWSTIGKNIATYRGYPRIVGETGGKDFILAHPSADLVPLAVAIVRGGYENQGQKCSAASRIYVPRSLWPALRERLLGMIRELRVGDVADFRTCLGAVIDRGAYETITGYVQSAQRDPRCHVLHAGFDDREGWFVQPTLVEVEDPRHRLMTEEIFGPVVSVFVYPDAEWEATLRLCDESSPYALTGAVFARDRAAVQQALTVLRQAAGNFYVNDKPTGAVVGQQPFGGARASGTNDKAGSLWNLMRWASPRVIKETFVPPTDWRYPYMERD